ncbi:MAG: hypothetical protein JNG85_12275 [Spirochaetaceae bacterium]|nr:hypothetical protein [Spirochaetaceae bacterium]
MRRSSAVVFVLAVSLAATSCDAFFTTNWFQKAGLVDQKAADLAALPAESLYERAYSQDGIASAAFFTALEGDAAAKAQVLATLEADWTGSASTAAEQRSAILYADILLETTQAGAVVDGIVAALASPPTIEVGDTDAEIATKYLQAALPASVLADEVTFTAAINAFIDANDSYLALGSGIVTAGAQPGVDIISSAQSAVVAALVVALDAATSGSNLGASLWPFVSGQTAVSPVDGTLTMPDFDNSPVSPLGSILEASGITLPNFGA